MYIPNYLPRNNNRYFGRRGTCSFQGLQCTASGVALQAGPGSGLLVFFRGFVHLVKYGPSLGSSSRNLCVTLIGQPRSILTNQVAKCTQGSGDT